MAEPINTGVLSSPAVLPLFLTFPLSFNCRSRKLKSRVITTLPPSTTVAASVYGPVLSCHGNAVSSRYVTPIRQVLCRTIPLILSASAQLLHPLGKYASTPLEKKKTATFCKEGKSHSSKLSVSSVVQCYESHICYRFVHNLESLICHSLLGVTHLLQVCSSLEVSHLLFTVSSHTSGTGLIIIRCRTSSTGLIIIISLSSAVHC